MKKRRGQVLVLVLLVVVVALAVGLSVASRNLTNLRTTTQTEQSQRAFNAAEGGIENTLSVLNAGGTPPTNVPVGNLTANVVVQTSHEYTSTIEEGNVGQVDLAGPPVATGILKIQWARTGDSLESDKPASIEVTQVYGSSPNYNQRRDAYSGGIFPGERDEVGFTGGSCIFPGDFKCEVTISLQSSPILLRIRPFWNKTTVKVTSEGGNLPEQQYEITSSATTELGLTRKIQVTKTAMPQLPAVFDYVLYSEGGIVK